LTRDSAQRLPLRALILAPSGRDASVAKGILEETGIDADICDGLSTLVRELERGAGLALVSVDVFTARDLSGLAAWLADQPHWSDFPFVVITHRGGGVERNPFAARLTDVLGNVSFLERPFHPTTLVSMTRAALRARKRQYEARARIEELKRTEDALAVANETLTSAVIERTMQLSQSEARFRAIFDSAFQLTGLTDLDGTILVANQTSLDAVGARLEDVVGVKLWDSIWLSRTPVEAPRLKQELARAARGEFVRYDLELLLPDDTTHIFDFSMKAVRDAAGNIAQIIVEGRDITELKRTTAALLHAQKMESLGQLTGGVAHDFNNLLMAIIANLDLLRKKVAADPKCKQMVENALQGAKRGATLTQRLLAFARKTNLHAEAVDLATLIAGMKDLLNKSIGPLIELRIKASPDRATATVDPQQLELALLNLAVNARDAMPKGGVITIAIDRPRPNEKRPNGLGTGDYVRVRVIDQGVGMDRTTRERAIEPFFSTKEVGKGTGLGLSMVHGLVVQSGGAMDIASAPGEGTTVEIWLPASTTVPGTQPVASHTSKDMKSTTILVVDDDALIAMSTADMLSDLGHEVIEAYSGATALEALRDRPLIRLMITDYAMPGMNGVQLASAARELRPDLQVLLATGYADLPDGAQVDLPRLAKPYMQHQLATQIARMLD
jgi:PAS domain S-box-containing protein